MNPLGVKNLGHLLSLRCQKNPQQAAYLKKKDGQWISYSWSELERQIFEVVSALRSEGIKRGDKVAIISQTRVEWTLVDLAVLSMGAVTVPIYHSVTADEVHYILNDSQARVVFLEDTLQRKKVSPLLEKLASVRLVVSFEGGSDDSIRSFKDFLAAPSANFDIPTWRADCETFDAQTLATIVYTSGTTGLPKGAELPHLAFLAMIADSQSILDIGPEDRTLLFLPTAHIMGRIEQMLFIGVGWTMAFAESMAGLMDNMAEIKPTILISVPRIYEKFYAALLAKFTKTAHEKFIFDQALKVGRAYSRALQAGEKPGLKLRLEYKIFDKLIFSKIREKFGGRLRFTVSGGAPLSIEIAEFFHACGVLVLEGYGLTESTGPIVVNRPGEFCFGTVGKVFPSVEIRIAEDGEILLKGPSIFTAYHGMPELTAASFVDGYFASGDIGSFDSKGFLKITDRKKDLIITAGGKNVAPQKIENIIKGDPLFSNAVIFGDREKFLVMLLCLNPSEVKRYFQKLGLAYSSLEEALRDPAFEKVVKARVDSVNAVLPSYEKVKRFRILPRDLSLEAGELTPSLKVKRKFCAQKYSELIQQMYQA